MLYAMLYAMLYSPSVPSMPSGPSGPPGRRVGLTVGGEKSVVGLTEGGANTTVGECETVGSRLGAGVVGRELG